MNNSQLDRVLRILARTGDRCLVFDRQNDQGVMVMSLDEYEKMLDGGAPVSELSEGDMLDKINRDLALWREKHDGEKVEPTGEEWNFDADKAIDFEPLEPEIDRILPEQDFASEAGKPLDLAENEGEDAAGAGNGEVKLSDTPHDGEEEKFYLEPVE